MFYLSLRNGVCITKYCLFTGDQWLPEEPAIVSGDGSVASKLLACVDLSGYFGVKGGEAAFVTNFLEIPVNLKLSESSKENKKLLDEVNASVFTKY